MPILFFPSTLPVFWLTVATLVSEEVQVVPATGVVSVKLLLNSIAFALCDIKIVENLARVLAKTLEKGYPILKL